MILPTLAIGVGGRAAWMVVIAAWLITAAGVPLAVAAARHHGGARFPSNLVRALPWVGRLVTLTIAGMAIMTAAGDLYLIFVTMDEIFMFRTPYLAVIVATAGVSAYQAWIGWRGIARISPLFLILVLSTTVMVLALLIPHLDPGYLRPVMDLSLLGGRPGPLVGALAGMHAPLLPLLLYARAAKPRLLLRDYLTGSATGAAVLLLFTAVPLMMGPPETLMRVNQVFPDVTTALTLPRSIFDRPEHLTRIVFNISALFAVSASLLTGAQVLAGTLNTGKWRPFVPPMAAAAALVAYLSYRLEWRENLRVYTAITDHVLLVFVALTMLLAGRRLGRPRTPDGET